jgi:hypothetical protein
MKEALKTMDTSKANRLETKIKKLLICLETVMLHNPSNAP